MRVSVTNRHTCDVDAGSWVPNEQYLAIFFAFRFDCAALAPRTNCAYVVLGKAPKRLGAESKLAPLFACAAAVKFHIIELGCRQQARLWTPYCNRFSDLLQRANLPSG